MEHMDAVMRLISTRHLPGEPDLLYNITPIIEQQPHIDGPLSLLTRPAFHHGAKQPVAYSILGNPFRTSRSTTLHVWPASHLLLR
jgi:hypothetical protein